MFDRAHTAGELFFSFKQIVDLSDIFGHDSYSSLTAELHHRIQRLLVRSVDLKCQTKWSSVLNQVNFQLLTGQIGNQTNATGLTNGIAKTGDQKATSVRQIATEKIC